ncbi:MAG: hypothetical protein IJ021_00980 [Clostridia bacterium]|nr:hypothetical protein [Clostridia bacterium]
MNTKPIIHVHYMNDDYKEWAECPKDVSFEKYLLATPGRIFEKFGGFDPFDVLSVSKYKIVLRLDKEIGTLRPGETITMHYVLPGLIADGSGFEYFTATVRWLTEEEAADITAEPINGSYLAVKWNYEYDKEGTWFDNDSGEDLYALEKGASYPLPRIWEESLEIRSLSVKGGVTCAEIYVDHSTVTVLGDGKPAMAHASDSYSVAGDCVDQSLDMSITIENNEQFERRAQKMSKAIGIKVKKAPEGYDLGASKFFGTPTVPLAWNGDFYEDEIFFCQIKLSDIAELDKENRLPHTGYLYIFLETDGGIYHLKSDVRYYDGEPELAIDDFNTAVEGYEQYNDAYLMEFYEADEGADGIRLLGVPSDWAYGDEPPKLFMQYDPLGNKMGFLDNLDGFVYFFFGEDEKDLTKVTLQEEYS